MRMAQHVAAWAKSGYTAKDYVQDGLIAMWDGIENAGWGIHDPNATVWKDISGHGNDAVLSGSISFVADHIVMTGGNASIYGMPNNLCVTTEIVFLKTRNVYTQFVEFVGYDGGCKHIGVRDNSCLIFHNSNCGNYPVNTSVINQASFDHSLQRCFINGLKSNPISNGGSFSTLKKGFGVYNSPFNEGLVYSCRVYSRTLLSAEIAANYAIDKARFGLPDKTT